MTRFIAPCEHCTERSRKRIDAACAHNPEKLVEWWEEWFSKELEKHLNERRKHGCF